MRLAVSDHCQKASARMIVLGMSLQMLREILNAFGQYGNLHFWRTRVFLMDAMLDYKLLLLDFGNHTSTIAHFDLFCKLAKL